ncbi:hypothetical protein EV1_022013 [Malus domestica]
MTGPNWCSSRAWSCRRLCQTGSGSDPAEKEIDKDDEDFDDERMDRESGLRVRQRPDCSYQYQYLRTPPQFLPSIGSALQFFEPEYS